MYQQILNKIKPELDKTIEHFKGDLSAFQTGRATPSLVEEVDVEAYDAKMKLKELAAISVPEPRQLLIQPWDRSVLQKIEKAIRISTGFSPVAEESSLRINIPSLNEEMRRNLVKRLKEKTEEARIAGRRHREEAWQEIQEGQKSGEISEDDKFRAKDKLQEIIEDFNKKIEDLSERKEKEIMG